MIIISEKINWLLRIVLAATFLKHGFPKLGVFVADLKYVGYLIGPFEFIGAVLLLIGPFINDTVTRLGSFMLGVIMIGAIYLHLFKWGDNLGDVEWQILLLSVSIYFFVKGNDE
tara:strand:- start:65 stop:406 length:342 start_codon:yes stop_codon:yes gene_type:complete